MSDHASVFERSRTGGDDVRSRLVGPPSGRVGKVGSSFYLEVLILVLVILFMALVLTAVLAHARGTALEAQRTTDATLLASDVAETYAAARTDADFADLLASGTGVVDGVVDDSGISDAGTGPDRGDIMARSGDAVVGVHLSEETTGAGVLHSAEITVSYDGGIYSRVVAQRYQSGRGVAP